MANNENKPPVLEEANGQPRGKNHDYVYFSSFQREMKKYGVEVGRDAESPWIWWNDSITLGDLPGVVHGEEVKVRTFIRILKMNPRKVLEELKIMRDGFRNSIGYNIIYPMDIRTKVLSVVTSDIQANGRRVIYDHKKGYMWEEIKNTYHYYHPIKNQLMFFFLFPHRYNGDIMADLER